MKHSSKKDPCGICGRTTDDKCRWSDNFISCYYGNSFHPPSSLRLGDRIDAFGKSWKLVKLNGGFSGGSYIFAVANDDEPIRRQTKQEREQYRKQIDFVSHKSKKLLSDLRKKVQQCHALKDFFTMTPNEIRKANAILQLTVDDCDAALKFVLRNQRMIANSQKLRRAYLIWQKSIRYQKKSLDLFIAENLGIAQ